MGNREGGYLKSKKAVDAERLEQFETAAIDGTIHLGAIREALGACGEHLSLPMGGIEAAEAIMRLGEQRDNAIAASKKLERRLAAIERESLDQEAADALLAIEEIRAALSVRGMVLPDPLVGEEATREMIDLFDRAERSDALARDLDRALRGCYRPTRGEDPHYRITLDTMRVQEKSWDTESQAFAALAMHFGLETVPEPSKSGPIWAIASEVAKEVERAINLHPAHNSHHEAYAVLLEEIEEYWDEVKKKRAERNPARMRTELIQVAAVAIRAVLEQFRDWPTDPGGTS